MVRKSGKKSLEVGNSSHYLQVFFYIPVGCLGFLPSVVLLDLWHFLVTLVVARAGEKIPRAPRRTSLTLRRLKDVLLESKAAMRVFVKNLAQLKHGYTA